MSRNRLLIALPVILAAWISVIGVAWRYRDRSVENDWTQPFRTATAGADRIVVEDGKFELTGESKVSELLDLIDIDVKNSGSHCLCDGDCDIRFYRGHKLLAFLSWHHGEAVRWRKGEWRGDAALTAKAQVAIPVWFEKNGFPTLETNRQSHLADGKKWQQRRERFQRHYPNSVKDIGDGKEVAAAICRAFGTLKDEDTWGGYTSDEQPAIAAMENVSGDDFLAALNLIKDDRDALHGAGRFYFRDFRDKIPRESRAEWSIRLSEITLTDGRDEQQPIVLRRLAEIKDPRVEKLLLDVFRNKFGKEVVEFERPWSMSREPGIRAGAALALSLQGKDEIKPEIVALLEKPSSKQDVAAYEVCLALLGEPDRLKKEHFRIASYSIAYAGLAVIERKKAKGPLMEVLVDGAFQHPWGAVPEDAVKLFQQVTGLELDREEIEAWWAIKQGRQPKTRLLLDCSKPVLVLGGPKQQHHFATFSPDGKLIAAVSDEKSITVWDATTGDVVKVLDGHTHWVLDLSFSPDGNRLVTTNQDRTLKSWETSNWAGPTTLHRQQIQINCVAHSPDGKLFAIATWSLEGTVKIYDAVTGVEKFKYQHHNNVSHLTFSADSKTIASTSHGELKVWHALSGEEVFSVKCEKEWFSGVAFSSNGKYMATGKGMSSDNGVSVFDATAGRELFSTPNQASSPWLPVFSPDSSLLAFHNGNKIVTIWDVESRKEKLSFKPNNVAVGSIAFHPDGSRLITSGDGLIKVWNLAELP
jgi:DNA-binding beta-propeller fold protein YncE